MLSDEQGLKKSECIPQECDGCRKCSYLSREDPARKHKKAKQRILSQGREKKQRMLSQSKGNNRVTEVGRVALHLHVLPTENT